MTQPPLDGDWWKRARPSDPETSRIAAKALDTQKLTRIENCVLSLLRLRPMHDHELIEEYRRVYGWAEESTIRTRRSELVVKKRVRDSGARWKAGKREATIWEVITEREPA